MNKFVFLIAFSMLGTVSYGQARCTVELTLQKAVELAYDSSIEAFRSQNIYLSKYWGYRNYKARRLPSITLKTTPIQYNRDIVQRYISDADRIEYRTQRSLYSYGNLSVMQNLDWTGGTFYLDSELGFFRNFGQSVTNQFTTVPIRVGYSQSLVGYNPFKWERLIEPIKYGQAKKELAYNLGATSVTVVDYFFSIVLAECNCKLAVKNMESCQRLYNEGIERHKNNKLSSTELLSIELALIDARNARISCENIRQKTLTALSSFLNIPEEDSLSIVIPNQLPVDFIDRTQALEYTRMNHPTYDEQKRNVSEAQQEVEKSRKERFLEANVNLSVGFNQVANELGMAYRRPLQQNVISVGVTIPLVDWGIRRGNYRMAQNNLKVTEGAARQEIQAVEEEILSVVNDFNTQVQILHASQRAVELAEQVYCESIERFRIGRDDINSLLDNMLKVQEAQIKLVQSQYVCWKSYYRIQQMTCFDFQRRCRVKVYISNE